jgi:hypothetical protein
VTLIEAPAQPNSWWTVEELRVGATGGLALYYRRGPRRPIRDEEGHWLRDAAGRTALEAFGALPLAVMYGRLREVEAAWQAIDLATRGSILERDPQYLQNRWQTGLAELISFVRTFGPLGFEWARTFEVANPEADKVLGPQTPARRWIASLPAPGFGRALVRRLHADPRGSWEDRVDAADMGIEHDFLGGESSGPLASHHEDLMHALRLVAVLAEREPTPHAVRDAAGWIPRRQGFAVEDAGARDPVGIRWSEAIRAPAGRGARPWSPFEEHITAIDWTAAGRMVLADFLSAQLAEVKIEAGLDSYRRFRTRWKPQSLLGLIYLQLLEHVEQRLPFGVGVCLRCGGPILRTRMAEGTRNRAHRGCAAVIRKRRQRERNGVAGPSAMRS